MPAVRATITVVTATATVTLDPLARNPVAQDAGSASDLVEIVVHYRRFPVDQAGVADVASRALGKALADTAGATDDLNGALAGDDQTIAFTKGLGEAPAASDAYSAAMLKPAADGAAAADVASRAFSKPALDALSASDQFARIVQYRRDLPAIYALDYFAEDYTATDKALVSDLYRIAASKPLADAALAADLLVRNLGKPVLDAAAASDAPQLGLGRPVADAASVLDILVRGFGATRTETGRVGDSGALAMPNSYSAGYFASDYCGSLLTW